MPYALSHRLAVLLAAAVALTAVPLAVPGPAVAVPVVQRSALGTSPGTAPELARLGGFRTSRRYSRPYYRRTYRRPFGARGFWHGVFWGWMLSHFFGFGYGFPLFVPFLLVVFALMAFRRRRPPAYRSRTW